MRWTVLALALSEAAGFAVTPTSEPPTDAPVTDAPTTPAPPFCGGLSHAARGAQPLALGTGNCEAQYGTSASAAMQTVRVPAVPILRGRF